MENFGFALTAGWQVVLAGLVLGAGLPAVFALGIRALAPADGADAAPRPAGVAAAGACFVVVALAIALGLTFIVASGLGKELDLGSGLPTLADKQ